MQHAFLRRTQQTIRSPHHVIALMASGMAVCADSPFSWLQEHYHRHTVVLDMEVASFYQTLRSFPHALVVKGVCDYADQTKNDEYHDYAACVFAVYLLLFIQEYVTQEKMPYRESSSQRDPPTFWNVPYPRNLFFFGREAELA